jgi:hypothetical protein
MRQSPGVAPTAASPASTDKLVVRRAGALLAQGTVQLSPHQDDRYFEHGVLDRA